MIDWLNTLPFADMTQADLLVSVGFFFGALMIFEGMRQILSRPSSEAMARNRRIRMQQRGVDDAQILAALTRNDAFDDRKGGLATRLRKLLRRANLPLRLPAVVLGNLALSVGVCAALLAVLPPVAAAAIAFGPVLVLPWLVIAQIGNSRMAKLVQQLPEALEMMARGLRVGHPVAVTLQRVASAMPDPIGTEMGIMEDRVRHGAEVGETFREFAQRVDLEDARYLAASIAIQHGTGGNLGRILLVLSAVIRQRLNMRKKIRAISSEGRLSGMILSVMPFIIAGTIFSSTPSFYLDVADHPIFLPVAFACGGLLVLQALILRRLTHFDF